ncbi:Xaa-Pro peptidase family protein [Rhizobium sp. 1AS11]|uniref:M24 family metallopeptidase n=1 Tax=Rhizobium acaciae TaxID=2989736 RepID=UPI002223579F|nr:Xaa-Pro peptidase family protein [Rhizobium acaciae]MCW1413814.1 Xaa-Pro peptidase family protein [Rhizobium acaciae]MCW1745951.1 Xaa-Pro peptidase family protein [Rhizobium acaciae]
MGTNLIFSREEYERRVRNVQADMQSQDLDALLAFEPESITYLTGFLSPRGYNCFHFAIIPRDGEPVLFFRDLEAYHFQRSAAFDRNFRWADGDDVDALAVGAIKSIVGQSAKVGVEKFAWQLNASRYERLAGLLPETLVIADAQNLVRKRRLIKSRAEMDYQRRAGRAAEMAMDAARKAARAGARERDIGAAVAAAMVLAGSDRAEPGPIASGEAAKSIHCMYTDRTLQAGDTVQLEMCPHVQNYHARFMRPLKVGHASAAEERLANQLFTIQDHALSEIAPGVAASVPDKIYREGIVATGIVDRYTNKTFYSVGLMLYPNGAEYLEVTPQSSWSFQAGMTFHTYLVVDGFAVSETIAITATGCEKLTNYPRELIVS